MRAAKTRPSAEHQAQNAALMWRSFLASYPAHNAPMSDAAKGIRTSPITLSRVEGGRYGSGTNRPDFARLNLGVSEPFCTFLHIVHRREGPVKWRNLLQILLESWCREGELNSRPHHYQ